MKSVLLFMLTGFAVLVFSSCTKTNPTSNSSSGSSSDSSSSSANNGIWPLNKGYIWNYSVESYDTSGNVTITSSRSLLVATDTTVGGKTWYGFSGTTAGTYYRNESDGLWVLHADTQAVFFKYPDSTGDRWEYHSDSVYVVTADTLVTTPANKYTCYEYRVTHESLPVEDYYLSPGTGMVASTYYGITSSGRVYIAQSTAITSSILQ